MGLTNYREQGGRWQVYSRRQLGKGMRWGNGTAGGVQGGGRIPPLQLVVAGRHAGSGSVRWWWQVVVVAPLPPCPPCTRTASPPPHVASFLPTWLQALHLPRQAGWGQVAGTPSPSTAFHHHRLHRPGPGSGSQNWAGTTGPRPRPGIPFLPTACNSHTHH